MVHRSRTKEKHCSFARYVCIRRPIVYHMHIVGLLFIFQQLLILDSRCLSEERITVGVLSPYADQVCHRTTEVTTVTAMSFQKMYTRCCHTGRHSGPHAGPVPPAIAPPVGGCINNRLDPRARTRRDCRVSCSIKRTGRQEKSRFRKQQTSCECCTDAGTSRFVGVWQP